MQSNAPNNIRRAARVILVDELDRVLLFRATEPQTKKSFWVTPGGGVEADESFEDAAARELLEETGFVAQMGPYVWFREHHYTWDGRKAAQYERFFVARTSSTQRVSGASVDSYLKESRWWSLGNLCDSAEDFTPQRIRDLLPGILRGEFSSSPIDCGI